MQTGTQSINFQSVQLDFANIAEAEVKAHLDMTNQAFHAAQQAISPYILSLEIRKARVQLEQLQALGPSMSPSEIEGFDNLKGIIAEAQVKLDAQRPQYTRCLKSLLIFVSTAARYAKVDKDIARRGAILKNILKQTRESLKIIETGSDRAFINGSLDQHLIQKRGTMPLLEEEELDLTKMFLESSISCIDAKQEKRLELFATNPAIQMLLAKHEEGAIAPQSSAILFLDSGRPFFRIDACFIPKTRPGQSVQAALEHAARTPEFIDLERLGMGLGADGAGLFRFSNQIENITGCVVLSPELGEDGKAMLVAGMKHPKRLVSGIFGEVPEEIKIGLPYGTLLNKFKDVANLLLEDRLSAINKKNFKK
ncbi:MAG: hypothetical protein KIT34_00795 [Cyanobacteria bacterium TGS_CYA1]|nr:hypothetical protein [Cyanobacteria bacterium TGS_CYA1]